MNSTRFLSFSVLFFLKALLYISFLNVILWMFLSLSLREGIERSLKYISISSHSIYHVLTYLLARAEWFKKKKNLTVFSPSLILRFNIRLFFEVFIQFIWLKQAQTINSSITINNMKLIIHNCFGFIGWAYVSNKVKWTMN